MIIWKYPLSSDDIQTIYMPEGARMLSVQLQHGTPQLWALCDECADKKQRRVAIYGTGCLIPNEPGRYIDTFQINSGELVFHVFDISDQ